MTNGRCQVASSGRKEKTAYRGVSGLVSGHRYFSPEISRWPSRDPIGERGFELMADRHSSGESGNTQSRDGYRAISYLSEHPSAFEQAHYLIREAVNKRIIAQNRFVLFDPALRPLYLFVNNRPLDQIDILGLDNPGCNLPTFDGIGRFLPPCYLECCARHDECYDIFKCTSCSWTDKGMVITFNPCAICNAEVVGCVVGCASVDPNVDDPKQPNFYCGQCHQFFRNPDDHAGHGT